MIFKTRVGPTLAMKPPMLYDWPHIQLPCVPTQSRGLFFKDFERYMDLKDELMSEIVYGRRVNVTKLEAVYSPDIDRSRQTYHMQAWFCLLNFFLFVDEDNNARFSSLITITEQLEEGQMPMSLCVGEMITSLVVVKKDPKGKFLRSPVLSGENIFSHELKNLFLPCVF